MQPPLIADFLSQRRIAVAGVSRSSGQAANAIFRRLRGAGYDAVPVNPRSSEVEGTTCYPNLGAIPEPVDGVVVATPPDAALEVVVECAELGIPRVWFHRSFGDGSTSPEAVSACRDSGIACIVGGCPLMYCQPVDLAHRLLRWWLTRRGRIACEHRSVT